MTLDPAAVRTARQYVTQALGRLDELERALDRPIDARTALRDAAGVRVSLRANLASAKDALTEPEET